MTSTKLQYSDKTCVYIWLQFYKFKENKLKASKRDAKKIKSRRVHRVDAFSHYHYFWANQRIIKLKCEETNPRKSEQEVHKNMKSVRVIHATYTNLLRTTTILV